MQGKVKGAQQTWVLSGAGSLAVFLLLGQGAPPSCDLPSIPCKFGAQSPHSSALEKTWKVSGKERYVCCPSMETLRVEGISPETFQTTGWGSFAL